MKPTPDCDLPPNHFLKLLNPLYEITESVDAWFHTYNKYLTQTLKIQPPDGDMSFCYNNKRKLEGLLAVYVHDTPAVGLKTFRKLTNITPDQFESNTK